MYVILFSRGCHVQKKKEIHVEVSLQVTESNGFLFHFFWRTRAAMVQLGLPEYGHLKESLRQLLTNLFVSDAVDILKFVDILKELRHKLRTYEESILATRSARCKLPAVMLASIFMFLDLLDQKDAMQVCSSWFKIMENPTLNTMFKRDWERVVVEPHHFADQQRFLPYGDTLLLPWMNQAGVLFGKYVQYRDWADFGLRLDGEQNLILARSNDYILYKKPKKFPVLINLNHFRYGSWVPKIFPKKNKATLHVSNQQKKKVYTPHIIRSKSKKI